MPPELYSYLNLPVYWQDEHCICFDHSFEYSIKIYDAFYIGLDPHIEVDNRGMYYYVEEEVFKTFIKAYKTQQAFNDTLQGILDE